MTNLPMTPVPKDHPLKKAWDEFQGSERYKNSLHWLRVGGLPVERDPSGELWDSFMAGWESAGGEMPMSGQADSPTLIGQKIVKVRPATDAELAQNGWERSCTVIVLDSGTTIFPSRDEEGNGPGALFGTAPDGTPIYVTARRR